MQSLRILIVGFYGRANFGDDVLLKVTHGLLKRIFPNARFSVIVCNESGDYVRHLIDDVTILYPARHGHFDFIVHGGGGVFFDFKTYALPHRVLEKVVHAIGLQTYVVAEKLLRKIIGKSRTSANRRLGFGIGVGTFEKGSQKLLYDSLPILCDFDALWVRDNKSVHNLERFGHAIKAKVVRGSDLAFLTDHWLNEIPKKPSSVRPRLGVVLSDRANNNTPRIAETIAELAKEYEITGFVLEEQQDPMTIALLSSYTTHIWRPYSTSIQSFMQHLAEQDVLLTSRAHGAICGACVGVPSVMVNIEPKLEQVHMMLSNASILLPINDTSVWQEAVKRAQKIKPDMITKDVEINRSASAEALEEIMQWMQ